MLDLSFEAYVWTKVVHLVAITAWIGGLVAMSEIFALHAADRADPAWAGRERALMARVVLPASAVALATGLVLLLNYGDLAEGWLHAKITAVALLLAYQILLARMSRRLSGEIENRPAHVFRRLKLFPIVLFIGIVALVMVRPF